jgi:hypothetical protein
VNLDDLVSPQRAPWQRAGGVSMHDVAIALHGLRKAHGLAKYESLLQAGNGRKAAVDVLQEQLDRVVYDLQVVCEAQAMAEALGEFHGVLLAEASGAVVQQFDVMFSPEALAERADAVAERLIDEASRNAPEQGGTA